MQGTKDISSDNTADKNMSDKAAGDSTVGSSSTNAFLPGFFKSRNRVIVHQTKILWGYLMQQMEVLQLKAPDPLAEVAFLYTFKALFEKSPKPRTLDYCFEHRFLPFLMKILQRDFMPSDKDRELVVYPLAMEILWWFSRVDAEHPRRHSPLPLLEKELVTLVSSFTDINSWFYRFSLCFSSALDGLCRGVSFRQQSVRTVPLTKAIWGDITVYRPWMLYIKYGSIPHLHQCSLTLQSKGRQQRRQQSVQTITTQLITDGLAWPEHSEMKDRSVNSSVADLMSILRQQHPAKAPPPGDQEGAVAEDVVFLNTIGGHYFWAYIGKDAVETVERISKVLLSSLPSLKPITPRLDSTVVAVVKKRLNMPSVIRGHVMCLGEDEVTVLALDYGVMRQVKVGYVYEMGSTAVQLGDVAPQAKLCCLAGVRPPPLNEPTVELALAFLTNLTKHYSDAGYHFQDAVGSDNLCMLINVASPSIRLQALRLLSNLSSISRLTKAVDWTPFIRPLLDLVTESMVKIGRSQGDDSLHRNSLVAALYALTNIMFGSPEYKKVFFQHNGHVVVLNTVRLYKCSFPIVRAAMGVMRTALSGLIKSLPRNLDKVTVSTDLWEEDGEVGPKSGKKTSERPSPLGAASHQNEEEEEEDDFDREISDMMTRLIPQDNLEATEEEQEETQTADTDRNESWEAGSLEMTEHRQPANGTGAVELTGAANGSSQLCGESHQASDLIPLDGVSLKQKPANCFEIGTTVPFQEDLTHHILDVQSINSISADQLTEVITGMLNSKGGTVYLGLTKEGGVRGIKVDRVDREFLRLAVDEVMARCNPVVPHNLINLRYVTVMRRAGADALGVYREVCVVEILVQSPIDKSFYTVDKGKICYHRVDAETRQLTEQDVREMVVQEEEKQFLPLIDSLLERIRQLKEQRSS
ncbi:uncharacterized protein LOC143289585 isoform X2 [Babylonia areolata]|uniref:uncharacterized protein LOC143289585 isoform X2 n=1 Tax=Babylonia areolata TaxID=304850 RepID=UPI003FD3C7FA